MLSVELLYTSIVATLAVRGVVEAVLAARGPRIFVGNLMTERGETDGYGLAAHLDALATAGPLIVSADLLERDDPVARHAVDKLGPLLCQLLAASPAEMCDFPAVGRERTTP